MKPTRERPAKIGVKDVVRAWRTTGLRRPPRHHGRTLPRLQADHQRQFADMVGRYRPRGVDPVSGKRFSHAVDHDRHAGHALAGRGARRGLGIKGASQAGKDPAADRKAAIAEAALERASTVERSVADYIAILPTKEKKGGGLISRRMGERAGRSPQPRRDRARNRVLPACERRRQDSAQASAGRGLSASFRRV